MWCVCRTPQEALAVMQHAETMRNIINVDMDSPNPIAFVIGWASNLLV